jgi:hypothetical protein
VLLPDAMFEILEVGNSGSDRARRRGALGYYTAVTRLSSLIS